MLCEVKGLIFNGVPMLDTHEIVEWGTDLIAFVSLKGNDCTLKKNKLVANVT